MSKYPHDKQDCSVSWVPTGQFGPGLQWDTYAGHIASYFVENSEFKMINLNVSLYQLL